ncbi:MAG: hypothetical protein KAV87_66270 [Desulfobacteraceae bacterium]|nr:hypothetical protein [Desulfobacteraceae bacterium]
MTKPTQNFKGIPGKATGIIFIHEGPFTLWQRVAWRFYVSVQLFRRGWNAITRTLWD